MGLALLILNVKNPVGLGLKVDGTAAKAMQSLEDNHNKVTEMGLVNALCDLHTAYLVPGTPLSEHVSRLRSLWQVANDMGAKIDDSGFRTIFISLLGAEWDNVVPVIHTFKTSSEAISKWNQIIRRSPPPTPPLPRRLKNIQFHRAFQFQD